MTGKRLATDLTDQRFTRLVVLGRLLSGRHGQCWRCLGDCGTEVDQLHTYELRNNRRKSCGCLPSEIIQRRLIKIEPGQRFGRLQAIERMPNPESAHQL